MKVVIHIERTIEVDVATTGSAASLAGRMNRALNDAAYTGAAPPLDGGLDACYRTLRRVTQVSAREGGRKIISQRYEHDG